MLSFTNQSKGTSNKWINNEPNFEPIIITNKLPKEVSPIKDKKYIGKVTDGQKKFRQSSKDFQKPKTKEKTSK